MKATLVASDCNVVHLQYYQVDMHAPRIIISIINGHCRGLWVLYFHAAITTIFAHLHDTHVHRQRHHLRSCPHGHSDGPRTPLAPPTGPGQRISSTPEATAIASVVSSRSTFSLSLSNLSRQTYKKFLIKMIKHAARLILATQQSCKRFLWHAAILELSQHQLAMARQQRTARVAVVGCRGFQAGSDSGEIAH